MQEKQFAFIPWWIAAVLSRNNLKSEDLLSFERIRPFFSTEDLTSLVATSSLARFFVGDGVGPDTVQWWDRWLASASDARTKQIISDNALLAGTSQTQEETLQRLAIEPSTVDEPVAGLVPLKTFEVSLMGDSGVAVFLQQGYTLAQHAKNSINLLRCLVKKLYVYEDYPQLVSRPVGQAYIESLMH
jgi:hypothetical protein